ncbi:hypothetical protein [Lentzea sp. NPDC059081]|uniref:hypothetical protein n=1 Tax=Lentzea sp. NPDC059081 TaxID=3346719 RepID=UPI00367F7120
MSDSLSRQTEPPLVFARLFAVVVAGAAGGSPQAAMPVSVMSSLWWAGIEAQSNRASTELPLRHLRTLRITEPLRQAWADDLEQAAAFPEPHPLGHDDVEQVLKPGASNRNTAYARDALMAARTCGVADTAEWYAFGCLYGLLVDQAAANSGGPSEIPPLLVAHACSLMDERRRGHVRQLRHDATWDVVAKATLRDVLTAPAAVELYNEEVRRLHSRALAVLARSGQPNPFSALLRARLDGLLQHSGVRPREVVGVFSA